MYDRGEYNSSLHLCSRAKKAKIRVCKYSNDKELIQPLVLSLHVTGMRKFRLYDSSDVKL